MEDHKADQYAPVPVCLARWPSLAMVRGRQPRGGLGPSVSMRGGRPPSKPTGMRMSVAVDFSGGEDFSSHVRIIIGERTFV